MALAEMARYSMKTKITAWIELIVGLVLVAIAVHPFTRFCEGRSFGLDCESRSIFGVNLFGPLGLALVLAGAWMLMTGSRRSQYLAGFGIAGVTLHLALSFL